MRSASDVALRWEESESERDHNALLQRPEESRRNAVVLAALLLFVGVIMLISCAFIVTGVIDAEYWYPGEEGWEGPALTFLAIGMLTCLPGTYAMRIVWNVHRGTPGFSLNQLPVVR